MAPGRIKRKPDNIYDPNRKQTQTARVAVGGASTGCGPLFLRRARDLDVTTGSSSQSNRTLYVRDRLYFKAPRPLKHRYTRIQIGTRWDPKILLGLNIKHSWSWFSFWKSLLRMTNGQSEPYPNRKRPGKNKIRTINKNQSHYVYFFVVGWSATCTLSYHSNVYRMQKLLTTKKLEIYTQICKRNGTNSQHEKTFCQISHVFHTTHSCSWFVFWKRFVSYENDQNVPHPNWKRLIS